MNVLSDSCGFVLKQNTTNELRICDWSSDVCSSDLFERVVKRFGDVTVLDELDFHVEHGEKVTIIGPSGSGKSTVLRILMTLEGIDDGEIGRASCRERVFQYV